MIFTSRSLQYYFRDKIKLTPINKTMINSKTLDGYKSRTFYSLNTKVVGETVNSKIKRLMKILKKDGSDHIFISAPENVAWLLNIRGRDNPFSPIPYCRIILNTKGEVSFFFRHKKLIKYFQKERLFENFFFS